MKKKEVSGCAVLSVMKFVAGEPCTVPANHGRDLERSSAPQSSQPTSTMSQSSVPFNLAQGRESKYHTSSDHRRGLIYLLFDRTHTECFPVLDARHMHTPRRPSHFDFLISVYALDAMHCPLSDNKTWHGLPAGILGFRPPCRLPLGFKVRVCRFISLMFIQLSCDWLVVRLDDVQIDQSLYIVVSSGDIVKRTPTIERNQEKVWNYPLLLYVAMVAWTCGDLVLMESQ